MSSDKFEAARSRAVRSLKYLTDLASDGRDFERILDGYLETRRQLTRSFREMASEHLTAATDELETTSRRIRERMLEMYDGQVSDGYLVPGTFSRVHSLVLGYLIPRCETPVPAARIRVLTGEQVHTERRIRELRDFGYDVTSSSVSGEQTYTLQSSVPNLDEAAMNQVRRNIMADRSIDKARRHHMVADLGLSIQ